MARRGKLIVIDGIDKVGKATQTRLLAERLNREGRKTVAIHFPRYDDNRFGRLIGECLRGEHGDFLALDPRLASTLYAADRFETKPYLERLLLRGVHVIADRYVSSNQIHQGGKIKSAAKRQAFLAWLEEIEYGIFKMPRPELVVLLDLPVKLSLELLDAAARAKTMKPDTVERDLVYYRNSARSARELARREGWSVIACARGNAILSREAIHESVYGAVRSVL